MSVLYGLYDETGALQLSTTLTTFYNATSRAAWAVAVCWVIVACATGHGGKEIHSFRRFVNYDQMIGFLFNVISKITSRGR